MRLQKTVKDFQDYRILYSVLLNEGKSALDMADYPEVSKNRIYKTVEKYNRPGAGRKDNVHHDGRREVRCIMSLEKDALTGELITYRQIKSKNDLLSDKKTVKSITGFKWIMDAIKVLNSS
jgi:hypothetical protein